MKILHFLALAGFLLVLEAAVYGWRISSPGATASVFALPMTEAAMKSSGDFQSSIEKYRADRGAQLKLPGPDGTSLTLFYFEWDQVDVGSIMSINLHEPEVCNSSAGFTFKSRNPNRIYQSAAHSPLVFDVTTFCDPSGRNVHVFRTPWVQGLGSWDSHSDSRRLTRLKLSFTRGRGVARLIECGITGAKDETQAWQIFHSEVLGNLAWSQ